MQPRHRKVQRPGVRKPKAPSNPQSRKKEPGGINPPGSVFEPMLSYPGSAVAEYVFSGLRTYIHKVALYLRDQGS